GAWGEEAPTRRRVFLDRAGRRREGRDEAGAKDRVSARVGGIPDGRPRAGDERCGEEARPSVEEPPGPPVRRRHESDAGQEGREPHSPRVVPEESRGEVDQEGVEEVVVRKRIVGERQFQRPNREVEVGEGLVVVHRPREVSQANEESCGRDERENAELYEGLTAIPGNGDRRSGVDRSLRRLRRGRLDGPLS